MRFTINKYLYFCLCMIFLPSAHVALGDELPSYCREDPVLARELSQMGPVMGMGGSVSHGLLARSASEIVADQLCLGSDGHVFPWYFPASYQKAAKYYYKRKRPRLILALDVTYHDMKVLEYTSDKRKVLDALVPTLALDCESDFYDCSEKGDASYADRNDYRPTVLLGDLFFENLIDCSRGKPPKGYRIEDAKPRPDKLCYEEFRQLNRHLKNLTARYPNVHIFPANRIFTALIKYPYSIFYDEGAGGRQTFFSRKALTWDGWHPYTDPGSYVFANLAIMQINRLVEEGKIKGRPIPLRKLSDEYFNSPSGLIIFVPEGFPRVTRPQIVGPAGGKIPLRFFTVQTMGRSPWRLQYREIIFSGSGNNMGAPGSKAAYHSRPIVFRNDPGSFKAGSGHSDRSLSKRNRSQRRPAPPGPKSE